ncbi:hypothetical protein LZQ00_03505 [Sphingobacterium sp. SRCM116780]|uniref:hypothetical protein n=1 Tax=Sphingobacterium sp. SRCM116780 TaxID=2907623 RepID=UPI001F15974A|nr:hypothetical protein [Sphingobacterium sp. SRCM116780]UIR56892.1 hypothetical protein LZQ00_03505 [Sphingobacterium sp. SRCM116780]
MKRSQLLTGLTFIAMSIILHACAQNKSTKNTDKQNPLLKTGFIIGNYKIVPDEQAIYRFEMTGGVDWDGFKYEKDPKIDFNKTTLYIIGDFIYLKEDLPFGKMDLSQLRIMQQKEGDMLLTDSKTTALLSRRYKEDAFPPIAIGSYSKVNDYIYKKGNLYYLLTNRYALQQADLSTVDVANLKHIDDNFFYDKNALYYFNEETENELKPTIVAKSNNQNPIVEEHERYFCFENNVFAKTDNSRIEKLDLDRTKIKELVINAYNNSSFVTDGHNYYEFNYGYSNQEKNTFGYGNQIITKAKTSLNLLATNFKFRYLDTAQKEGLLVTKDIGETEYMTPEENFIAQVDGQYFRFFRGQDKPQALDNIWIYNATAKKKELLDLASLKTFDVEELIWYKNVLYYAGYVVDTENWDLTHFKRIEKTNFYTDGNLVIYLGDISGISMINKKGEEMVDFSENIVHDIHFSKDLKIINKDALTDDHSIIYKTQAITFNDLKMKVKVVLP